MDDNNAMVEKSNHELKQQLGISDDIIISKFSNDFSLKLLSPLIRLKKGLNLSLPELVSRSRDRENLSRPGENGQTIDGIRQDCGADTRHGMTNNDGLDLGQSIHEETLEDTCDESEPLQPELKSSEAVKVNDDLIRTENVADKQVVKIKRKRGRPPKICKLTGGAVSKSTSSSKKPHRQSIVFPQRKPGRPRKNEIPSHNNAQKVNPTAVPISPLSGATKSRRNIPCRNPKRGPTALKDPIVRDYPLRRLFQSTSRNLVLSKRFPGYANVLGQVARNSSAHSKRRNSTSSIGKDKQCITGDVSEATHISQDHIESKEEIAENHQSKLCGEPGDTTISVEQTVSNNRTSKKETCHGVPSTISPVKCNLTCVEEKTHAKKKSPKMSKLVRCHSVERLPSLPICVDPTAKIKKWEPFSRCCGKRCETRDIYNFTDSMDEGLSEPTSPLTNKPQRKRGRPPKQKESDAVGTIQVPTKLVQSWRGLSLRNFSKSEMTPSRNVNSLEIVHDRGEPQKKRNRGRPRKHRTTQLPSQKNCQEEIQQLYHIQKPDRLHQEGGCVGTNAKKGAEFIDLTLQQERLVEDKLPETDRNSNQFYVPKSMECGQQKKDVSLLHNTQPDAVRDDSDHMSSAIWTPSWKDKAVLECQGGSDQVTCLTPPGSNECLSTISGDEYPQTLEEPNIQKAYQIPSNINFSSSPAQASVSKGITSPLSSNPGLPQFPHGATTTDRSPELLDRIGSCSPSVLQEESSENMCVREQNNKSITCVSQGDPQDIFRVATGNSIQESDGLSQVRIAKTVTLSTELSSSCTQSEDVEALPSETNSMTSSNNVPVKVVESSSILPRKERENIFQALRGGLDSQSPNLGRDLDQSGSNDSTPGEDWHLEMSVRDPEIPQLEAYGGGHGGYASHNSPHSGDFDTLPILEKQAFHDTCLDDDEDDDDEFEFENPSDVTSDLNKPSDNIPGQDYYDWPKESGPPGSGVDIIIAAEPVHQDLQHEAAGIAEDEDEFEFETPEESDTTPVDDPSLEERPPESDIASSDSMNAKPECIDEDKNTVNTPNKMAERQRGSELQCADEQCETSFPVVGISPNHMEFASSLQSSESIEDKDCMSSQSNNPDSVPIPACKDNTEEPNGNNDTVFVSERALLQTPSKDVEPADIINIQNDPETNSITSKSDDTSEEKDEPEDKVMQEIVQQETHSQSFPDESNDEPTTEGSDKGSNPAECNDNSDEPNTSQDMSGDHFQTDTTIVAAKAKDASHCSDTEDVNGQSQDPLPVTDGEESPNPTDQAVNEETYPHSKLCDVEDSQEYKASTSVHEVMPEQCHETIATSPNDTDNVSSSTSQGTEEELSGSMIVVDLQHSDTKATHPSLPICKETSEDTLESKKAGEGTCILQKNEDCSKVIELQDKLEEPLSSLSASPDVKELCTISIDKTVHLTELTKHNEQQEPKELDDTEKKNDSPLSKDLQDDSDLTQPKQTMQQTQMDDASQQSKSSKLYLVEEEQNHEIQENNNSQPCSPKEKCMVDDQSSDPRETAELDQSQKESATEELGKDCPTKSVGKDSTLLHESVNNDTQPNGSCESLANNTDTSQDGNNSNDVNSSAEVPQSPEQIIDLVDETRQTDQDGFVYLGVSTSDGTMDMLSIACEETIGGYDEDAMSTTSSGDATIPYPLSDGEDWNDQHEHVEKDGAQLEVGKSSTLQDTPNLSTAAHGKDGEHSASSTACKWTVKFTKAKKRKRSRDRHHAKSKRKSNKKHKHNNRPSKEREDKRHLEKPLVPDADGTVESNSDGTAPKLPEKQGLEQKEPSTSHLEEVAIDKEPTEEIVDKPLIENKITENVDNQKSTQETCLGSNISCESPNPKSPTHQLTHIHEAGAAETIAQLKMKNPIKVEHFWKKPSNDVYKDHEILNISTCSNSSSTSAEIDVTSCIEDPVVIVDNTPNTLSSSQESHNASVPVVSKNQMSHFQTSVPSGILPRTQDVPSVMKSPSTFSPSGYIENHQRETRSLAEKGNPGAKPTQYIPQDKTTFFGTPRKDRKKIRRQLNVQHPTVPYPGSYYLPPSQQSTQLLQQQHHLPLIQLRNPYLNPSGACNELKQHLLRKKKLAAPDLQKQLDHQTQSQPAVPDHRYLPNHNPNLQNPVIHPSERDMALTQLAQLRMQSQIERDQQSANKANRSNAPSTFPPGQIYPERFLHSSQRDLPVQTNMIHSGAPSISSMSVELGHRDSNMLQFSGSRVATAGTFSPPIVEDLTRKVQQIRNKAEDSRVGYSISPAHQHMGYAADIPVYTTTGPKEQVLAVYADGYAPVLQNDIPSHLNPPQNLQHARKSISTTKRPQSNPDKIPAQAHVDQDKVLYMLRQLHSGTGTVRNVPVMESPTSSIPFSGYPHISETTRPIEITVMNPQPPPTTNPLLHQPLNQSTEGYSSSATLRELAIQRENLVNSQYMLFNPHTMQNNAAIDFTNTPSRTPTPKMHSRTPTPKSYTTSTTYVSDHSINLAHQPTSELDRASLSRTSTPRSHCTPSSTPHVISDSALPTTTEVQRSQMSHNNFTPEEDMPLDLTCKVRPKVNVDQKHVSPLDLSCKQRTCDDESQEQYAAQVQGEVYEENRTQDNPSGSRSDHSGSDIAEAYGNGAQAPGLQSHVQSETDHSGNTAATLEPGQDISSGQAGYISNQDPNVARQVLNSDLHSSNLRHHGISGEATVVASSVLESGQLSFQEQYPIREANVYIDRAGEPHVFSQLLQSGLTAEGPGLKIAKTYNTCVNPPTTSASSIPLMDLTSLPKKMLVVCELGKSSVEVHHRHEQARDETNARIPTYSQDQPLNVTRYLRRTKSDQTGVRHSFGNSPNATTASQVGVLESSNNQPEVSHISQTNILRSVSASSMAITSTESKQAAENPEQLKSFIPQNLRSVSDMSQCPKKRFKRAHEASLKQSVASTPSEMPGVRTSGEVTEPTASLRPPGTRKRGRPRGSGKKSYEVSQPEVPVNQQCKFCEFETTSRQEMKNHVNEIHFEKYRTKAASDKSINITTNDEARQVQDTGKCDKLTDEYRAPVTPQTGLDALGSKAFSHSPSKDDDMPEGIGRNELSREMQLTGTDHCHHCDIDFPDTSSLAAHQRTHHQSEKKEFECRLCDYSDRSPGPLVIHINKVHSKQLKEGPCPFLNCSRTFPTVREVKEHLNDHWIVKQYACKICGVRYQVFSSLKAHLDRHKQDLPNMCKVCTLSFKTPGTLLRHQKLKDHLPKP